MDSAVSIISLCVQVYWPNNYWTVHKELKNQECGGMSTLLYVFKELALAAFPLFLRVFHNDH